MTNDAQAAFWWRLQLCGADTLTFMALGISFVTGFRHLLLYLASLALIVGASRYATARRRLLQHAPLLTRPQRNLLFACYIGPYVFLLLLTAVGFAFTVIEARLWTLLLWPFLLTAAMIVYRYYQYYRDTHVA